MSMDRFLGKVFRADALRLASLAHVPVDAVITDPMYGTGKNFVYEWGRDPARGDPIKHWSYHEPIYQECRRVLKEGGAGLAQGAKFCEHFPRWFGDHRLWTLTRFRRKGMCPTGSVWIVQTRERVPVEFPRRDSLVMCEPMTTRECAAPGRAPGGDGVPRRGADPARRDRTRLLLRPGIYPARRPETPPPVDRLRPEQAVLPGHDETHGGGHRGVSRATAKWRSIGGRKKHHARRPAPASRPPGDLPHPEP